MIFGQTLCLGLFFLIRPCVDSNNINQELYPSHKEVSCSIKHKEINQDTIKTKSYQSFDEFSMCGIGLKKTIPYVNVRKMADSIFVSSSDVRDSIRVYVKIDDDLWLSHMEYDVYKKGNMKEKCIENSMTRMYDRYFYNDTITEVRTTYSNNNANVEVFVKLPNKMFVIDREDLNSSIYSNINVLRTYVFNISQSKNKGVWEYELKEYSNSYSYEGIGHKYNYSYPKKAYGFWGIQPGITETFLYEGIDIREYADNLKSFQKKHPDFEYEWVDVLPTFPGGYDSFQAFIRKNRNNLLIDNNQVVVEVIIEKDGSISNAIISKSLDPKHNEDALKIISIMPKWKPGVLNGKKVRCKIKIPISYR